MDKLNQESLNGKSPQELNNETLQRLRQEAPRWTLDSEYKLMQQMEALHNSILKSSKELVGRVEGTSRQARQLSVNLASTTNNFHALANTQFIESRIHADDDKSDTLLKKNGDNAVYNSQRRGFANRQQMNRQQRTIGESERERLEAVKQALQICSNVLDAELNVTSTSTTGELLYETKDPYARRPLPFIIGTAAFVNDKYAGLTAPLRPDIPSKSVRKADGGNLTNGYIRQPVGIHYDGKTAELALPSNKHSVGYAESMSSQQSSLYDSNSLDIPVVSSDRRSTLLTDEATDQTTLAGSDLFGSASPATDTRASFQNDRSFVNNTTSSNLATSFTRNVPPVLFGDSDESEDESPLFAVKPNTSFKAIPQDNPVPAAVIPLAAERPLISVNVENNDPGASRATTLHAHDISGNNIKIMSAAKSMPVRASNKELNTTSGSRDLEPPTASTVSVSSKDAFKSSLNATLERRMHLPPPVVAEQQPVDSVAASFSSADLANSSSTTRPAAIRPKAMPRSVPSSGVASSTTSSASAVSNDVVRRDVRKPAALFDDSDDEQNENGDDLFAVVSRARQSKIVSGASLLAATENKVTRAEHSLVNHDTHATTAADSATASKKTEADVLRHLPAQSTSARPAVGYTSSVVSNKNTSVSSSSAKNIFDVNADESDADEDDLFAVLARASKDKRSKLMLTDFAVKSAQFPPIVPTKVTAINIEHDTKQALPAKKLDDRPEPYRSAAKIKNVTEKQVERSLLMPVELTHSEAGDENSSGGRERSANRHSLIILNRTDSASTIQAQASEDEKHIENVNVPVNNVTRGNSSSYERLSAGAERDDRSIETPSAAAKSTWSKNFVAEETNKENVSNGGILDANTEPPALRTNIYAAKIQKVHENSIIGDDDNDDELIFNSVKPKTDSSHVQKVRVVTAPLSIFDRSPPSSPPILPNDESETGSSKNSFLPNFDIKSSWRQQVDFISERPASTEPADVIQTAGNYPDLMPKLFADVDDNPFGEAAVNEVMTNLSSPSFYSAASSVTTAGQISTRKDAALAKPADSKDNGTSINNDVSAVGVAVSRTADMPVIESSVDQNIFNVPAGFYDNDNDEPNSDSTSRMSLSDASLVINGAADGSGSIRLARSRSGGINAPRARLQALLDRKLKILSRHDSPMDVRADVLSLFDDNLTDAVSTTNTVTESAANSANIFASEKISNLKSFLPAVLPERTLINAKAMPDDVFGTETDDNVSILIAASSESPVDTDKIFFPADVAKTILPVQDTHAEASFFHTVDIINPLEKIIAPSVVTSASVSRAVETRPSQNLLAEPYKNPTLSDAVFDPLSAAFSVYAASAPFVESKKTPLISPALVVAKKPLANKISNRQTLFAAEGDDDDDDLFGANAKRSLVVSTKQPEQFVGRTATVIKNPTGKIPDHVRQIGYQPAVKFPTAPPVTLPPPSSDKNARLATGKIFADDGDDDLFSTWTKKKPEHAPNAFSAGMPNSVEVKKPTAFPAPQTLVAANVATNPPTDVKTTIVPKNKSKSIFDDDNDDDDDLFRTSLVGARGKPAER